MNKNKSLVAAVIVCMCLSLLLWTGCSRPQEDSVEQMRGGTTGEKTETPANSETDTEDTDVKIEDKDGGKVSVDMEDVSVDTSGYEDGGSVAIESEDGSIIIDTQDGRVKVEDVDGGEVVTKYSDKIDDSEFTMPFYPGSEVDTGAIQTSEGEQTRVATLLTDDSVEEVSAFYKEKMAEAQTVEAAGFVNMVMGDLDEDGRTITVTIGEDPVQNKTTILISEVETK